MNLIPWDRIRADVCSPIVKKDLALYLTQVVMYKVSIFLHYLQPSPKSEMISLFLARA